MLVTLYEAYSFISYSLYDSALDQQVKYAIAIVRYIAGK